MRELNVNELNEISGGFFGFFTNMFSKAPEAIPDALGSIILPEDAAGKALSEFVTTEAWQAAVKTVSPYLPYAAGVATGVAAAGAAYYAYNYFYN